MKLDSYLIQEAYSRGDWLEAARLVAGDPALALEESQIRVLTHSNNVPEVIVDFQNIRRRWSSILGRIEQEEAFIIYQKPRLTVFTN